MKSLIKIGNKAIAILDNGEALEKEDITPDEFAILADCNSTVEDIYEIMVPSYRESIQKHKNACELLDRVKASKILTLRGESIYWMKIAEISLPITFAKAVLDAEDEDNDDKLIAYKNFWTLACLNPDERCRKNLFWFLEKNGFVISKCGFFVAYRNANYHSTEANGTKVYTDVHSGKFRIKIGEMVTMPREECDADQDHVCAPALHVATHNWLEKNYFGDTGMVCLVNPADVVAVPPVDSYGKMRTCAYLPIGYASYDEEGHIIPFDVQNGFDCSYVTKVIYEGIMGTEVDSPYKIEIPNIPGITNKKAITDTLLDIAIKAVTERQI